ncbi:alpha-tectorin-like [Misgurnus anguillicaudatus]|uniref:alpha-tectorin-like n=1 Tax=Misgurnus anguillicaudatus TaxID=75329 RepID=UPI003CCEFDF3
MLCCPGQNNGCYRGCFCDVACLTLRDCCSDYIQTCTSINGTLAPLSTTSHPYSPPTPPSPMMTSHSGLTPETQTTEVDPCYNYNVLDDLWRSTSNPVSFEIMCDVSVNWTGWYRLFIHNESVRIPDTCVQEYRCGTRAPLWLNGGHPTVEDGVVTRDVCGHWNGDCCFFHSNPIRVKACPDNYYVYEFVSPVTCHLAYCADVTNISTTPTSITKTTTVPTTLSYDPCYQYNTIDDYWRDIRLNPSQDNGHDDTTVEWNGWYRLYLNGESAQMSEWCVTSMGCGGYSGLYLSGSHPRLEDGVVTREVLGSNILWWYYGQCGHYSSNPIQVKACPGDYYVYELVTPDVSLSMPSYCAVAFSSINNDPCYNYESLDRPWRATTESGLYICDDYSSWNGWYRLYHYGMNIQMAESCVNPYSCNTYLGLSLNGPHPQIEDGVVTREVCGSYYWGGSCCDVKSEPIRVKACPGDYYVYELVKPVSWCSGYCTGDPCSSYNILDEYWRDTQDYWYWYGWIGNNDDTRVKWDGWYRLFINGSSAKMADWCAPYMTCGGYTSLWLAGSHPEVEDGVVTREVYGSYFDRCSGYTSNPIQVKACPGDYYVYKLTRPNVAIPLPSYCAVVYSTPSVDPCDSYTSLDEPWRSTDNFVYNYNYMCDYNVNWNGWYRLFLNGQSTQMSESCVGQGMCGTYYTLFLRDPHPQLEDGVVRRHVCMSTWYSCCGYESHPIQVKACPGNYYVYEFVKPFDCSAYCAGPIPFYPFGVGDIENERIDDGSSAVIYLLQPFIFFGHTYNQIYAGYDTIDSSYYFSITGSLQTDFTGLTYSTNVNVTGRWAFRTDYGPQGCQFNGLSVQLGDSFWSDVNCQERCTCTSSGLQCSLEPCTYSQACRAAAFQYSCQYIPRQTCTIAGDPHYYTFDNQIFHFQGTCTYVLSEACGNGLPYYHIEGKNDHRGSTHVSWTRMVRVFVYDQEIELIKDHYYEAKVNGTFRATPFTLNNGSIQVYQSGFTLVISTDFGLVVTYDAYSWVTISVPYEYQNATCGLCGNFNLHPEDDFRSPSGDILSSDVDFANSWQVEGDTDPECHNVRCTGLACLDCSANDMSVYSDTNHCGLLGDVFGPFAACHSVLAPQTYVENCVYDLCLGGGYQPILCQALNVYAAQCQQQGVQLGQWRRQGFCEINCPIEHSHFEAQGTSCPATCSDPSAPMNCPLPGQESCICDDGYILSAGTCVPEAACGCTFEGFYYAEGQSVVLDEDCGRQCVCSSMTMICSHHQCGPAEVCEVHNGVRGCRPTSYATCSVEGLGSYHTFDGETFRYPGACGLTLARVMAPSQLPSFALTVEKVPRGLQGFARFLKFEAEGTQVSIEMGEGSNVQVDGQMVGLPISVGSSQIRIYHSSVRGFVLETNFGVTIRADWPHIVRITAPSTYSGTLGGLCGNFNGNIDDEFYSPDGVLLNDTQTFADSWRDGSLSAHCEDPADLWEPGQYQNSSQFSEHCSIMTMPDGPFAECSRTIDPSQRIQGCIQMLEQTSGAREALCESLRGYTLLCQQKGITVGEWRSITYCDPICPLNTHYELCGTSCPASCPSLSFPFQYTLQCQEGCQCNDGLVLNGDQCVPPTGCGCHYAGRYRQPGEQFWHGEECQSLCVCNGITGNVQCTPSSCSEQEVCRVVDGEYGCHPNPHASCSASGDPHYISFDRTYFDFQGTCRYVLATVCNDTRGLPVFQVDARNEAWWGSSVSVTVQVFVNVSGHLVHMTQEMNGYSSVQVDGEIRNLPILLDSGRVSVYSTGSQTVVSTDFGFSVTYGFWAVNIIVPADYRGVTCGLCGNFNGHTEDDFMTPSGSLAPSANQFGAEWKVEDEVQCSDTHNRNDDPCQDQTIAHSLCEIIRDNQGPFSFCHAVVDPQAYFNDCSFDVCLSGNRNDVLCHSLESYMRACQSANAVVFPWRESASCVMPCQLENSHYELCGTDCGHTCASSVDASCEHTCSEGCFCNDGFVRSAGLCVPVEQCGCLYDGFYHDIGEQFWNSECSQRCECFGPNDLRCSASSCPATMECTVRNGHRGCYSEMSTCTVWGDPHYITFDGAVAHFQGTCSYEIAQTCGNATDEDLEFRVVATNRHRGNMAVSFVSVVDVWLSHHGQQAQITIGQNRRLKVNGNSTDSSTFQISDLVEVYEEPGFVVLNAFNEFTVHFDGQSTLLVRLSQSFHGSVCGMCGNYNGDPADDIASPNGDLAPNDNDFGNSWISDTSTPGCGASDRTANPDECPFKQEYSDLCSIITNTNGPFQECHHHVDPAPYYYSCVYDLCLYTAQNGMLCSAVQAYEAACVVLGTQIPEWRSSLQCSERDPCSALNCTEDEWCGEMNGVYGCLCNENQPRSDPDSFDFFETCESSTGSISISRCQLFEAGFSADGLHLNDPSCRGIIQNGRVEFSFDNNEHNCGTNLMANGTHIIYENFILGAPGLSEGLISRERILQISFSCVYPQTQTLSMIEINPLESRVNKNLVGQGMYQVRMIPYHDVGFSQPFNGSVNAELNQQIFVEVRVDGVDSRQLVTVIDTCWATPVNDPDYSLRWDLITGECPNPHDNTVKLLQNGVSTSSRFSFKMFIFNSNSTKVYLHCAVHLCILANNHCSAHCGSGYHQRVGRSLDFRDSSSISMGPFVWSDGNAGTWAPELVRASGAPGLTGCLMILLVSLLSACIIF